MMYDYKRKSGAQKRKGKIYMTRKTTDKIDIFFVKKATSSEQFKYAADFGLQ